MLRQLAGEDPLDGWHLRSSWSPSWCCCKPYPGPSGAVASFATMSQTTLLPQPPSTPAQRRSSKGIGPGDIVEVDKKGRRFHAIVVELDQVDSGRFHLSVRPLDSRISYRQATVREVVGVWRRARSV
jgi:hypothetical protein